VISGFQHEWRVHVSPDIEYSPSEAPQPFEAYGKNAHFVLEKCLRPKCKDCIASTIQEAEKQEYDADTVFENYGVLFGIKRNKALSIQVKKNKLQEMEESSSEEEKEQEEVEEEDELEEEDEEIAEEDEVEEDDDEDKEEEEESEESEEE
jgi:hypothetical protein